MSDIVMYTSAFCGYCRRARQLLDRKGVDYVLKDVDRGPGLWNEMVERSRRHTVPQIFIGDLHVGGWDDLAALDARGRLDSLLRQDLSQK